MLFGGLRVYWGMLRIIYAIILITVSHCYSQTCVIARKTKKAIYVGADSRTTVYLYAPSTGELTFDTGSTCKIFTHGKFNFATLGANLQMSIDEAISACDNSNSFKEVIIKYATSFVNKFAEDLEENRKKRFNFFSTLIDKQLPNLAQIIFFGKESDSLFLGIVQFRILSSKLEPVKLSAYFAESNILYGGHIDEIKDTMQTPKIWKRGTIETIKALISIEAKAYPLEVGGFIDMIKVSRKKTKWIQKKEACR